MSETHRPCPIFPSERLQIAAFSNGRQFRTRTILLSSESTPKVTVLAESRPAEDQKRGGDQRQTEARHSA